MDYKVHCINGHSIDKLCASKACQNPAAICKQQSCLCYQAHMKCESEVDVNKIIEQLNNKCSNSLKKADKAILQGINEMIQSLQKLREEYYQIGRSQFELMYQSKDVLELFNKGSTQNLKPKTVYYCLNRMGYKDEEYKIARLRNQISDVLRSHTKGMENIRYFWKQKQSFKFRNGFYDPQQLCTSDDGKSIKVLQFKSNGFAVVSPPFVDSAKIRYSVVESKGWMCVGAFDKEWSPNLQGVMIMSNGMVHNQKKLLKQHGKKFDFTFDEGDDIEVQYQKEYRQLKVLNLTNPMSGQQLYFMVLLSEKDDEIAIMK